MKNGFTLVELIAVIILIGLVGILTIIPINKTIKDSKDKLYDKQIEQIILAAQNWGSDNQTLLYTKKEELDEQIQGMNLEDENEVKAAYGSNPVMTLTIDELIDADYLESTIKDLKDEKNIIPGCSQIQIYFNYESSLASVKTYRYRFVRLEVC